MQKYARQRVIDTRTVIVHSLDTTKGNYGCILQAFALRKVVESLGHPVIHTTEPQPRLDRRRISLPLKAFIKRVVRHKTLSTPLTVREEELLVELPAKFARSALNIVPYDKIPSRTIQNSVHVFGSDQIWRPNYTRDVWHYFGANLNLDRTVAISYAASFGVDTLHEYPTPNEREKLATQLRKFRALSTREDSGLRLLQGLGLHAYQHLDPTMLLAADDYIEVFGPPNSYDRPTAFCYILDADTSKESTINNFCNKRGLKPVMFLNSVVRGKFFPRTLFPRRSVEDWVLGIASSDFVITDSFHGCVFAILFNRPFVAVVNKSRGATRFESLLKTFGLSNRAVNSYNSLDSWGEHELPIDWDTVNAILSSKRADAVTYLKSNLV